MKSLYNNRAGCAGKQEEDHGQGLTNSYQPARFSGSRRYNDRLDQI